MAHAGEALTRRWTGKEAEMNLGGSKGFAARQLCQDQAHARRARLPMPPSKPGVEISDVGEGWDGVERGEERSQATYTSRNRALGLEPSREF